MVLRVARLSRPSSSSISYQALGVLKALGVLTISFPADLSCSLLVTFFQPEVNS